MAACLGPSHGNCSFILLSFSTMFSFTNISNSSDLMVCFAMEAEDCLHWKITIVARPLKVLKHFSLLKGRLKYQKYLGCKSLRIQCQSEWSLSDFSKEQTWALETGKFLSHFTQTTLQVTTRGLSVERAVQPPQELSSKAHGSESSSSERFHS